MRWYISNQFADKNEERNLLLQAQLSLQSTERPTPCIVAVRGLYATPYPMSFLTQAYEMRALTILVDGVDEAAGLREIVEAFVHYELVPSGNRLVVTSRPEGVDLDDYKTRFVVMNLLELSQEQQRNVIHMQLQVLQSTSLRYCLF